MRDNRVNYGDLSHRQLMRVAENYASLAPERQAALREQFAQRGLEPPVMEDTESETANDGLSLVPDDQLVTVARYRDMPEAIVARSVLEAAGIDCLLRDENTVRMDWLWSNMIGGMRLQVTTENEAEARELLAQPMPASFPVDSGPDFVQPVCPRCGSMDVMPDDMDRKIKAASSFAGGIPLIVGLPALAFQRDDVWKCNACGCKWTDDGEPTAEAPAP
jgi:hypothetical protein